jgi:hypothetical protein
MMATRNHFKLLLFFLLLLFSASGFAAKSDREIAGAQLNLAMLCGTGEGLPLGKQKAASERS